LGKSSVQEADVPPGRSRKKMGQDPQSLLQNNSQIEETIGEGQRGRGKNKKCIRRRVHGNNTNIKKLARKTVPWLGKRKKVRG